MTKEDIDVLLMQINAMVDNVDDPDVERRRACALEIQRMAANLPRLVRALEAESADVLSHIGPTPRVPGFREACARIPSDTSRLEETGIVRIWRKGLESK